METEDFEYSNIPSESESADGLNDTDSEEITDDEFSNDSDSNT